MNNLDLTLFETTLRKNERSYQEELENIGVWKKVLQRTLRNI